MVRINLLAVRVSKKREAGKQQLVLFAVVVIAGFVGNFLWTSSREAALKAQQARLARTKDEIAQLDRIIGEVKNIKEAQKALKEKLDVLDRLKSGRTGPVRMLDELAQITPKRLWITSLEQGKNSLQLTGAAASIDDVSEFMAALKKSIYFADVNLKKTTAKRDGAMTVVDFGMSVTVRQGVPGAGATALSLPVEKR
jgi:type IV pilus assembly protein PilN